jgi:hypothetical protein
VLLGLEETVTDGFDEGSEEGVNDASEDGSTQYM